MAIALRRKKNPRNRRATGGAGFGVMVMVAAVAMLPWMKRIFQLHSLHGYLDDLVIEAEYNSSGDAVAAVGKKLLESIQSDLLPVTTSASVGTSVPQKDGLMVLAFFFEKILWCHEIDFIAV